MNSIELELLVREAFSRTCFNLGYVMNKSSLDGGIGGTNYKASEKYVESVSTSQINMTGVKKSEFEISIGASCAVLEIENLWRDQRYLVSPKLLNEEHQILFESQVPYTYSINYDSNAVKMKFPNNVSETGWLHFEISQKGLSQFSEVVKFILEEQFMPELNQYKDLCVLDKLVNGAIEPTHFKCVVNEEGIIYRRIILANLANNPNYAAICDRERSFFSEYIAVSKEKGYEHYGNIPLVFDKVQERLKALEQRDTTLL
jgi:hypothetical protein